MEKFAQFSFLAYVIPFLVLIAIYFINPKPLLKVMKYSTAGMFVLIAILLIALLIAGKLFQNTGKIPYF